MLLSALAVQNAKPRAKLYLLRRRTTACIFWSSRTDSKLWRFRYRFAGKQNMLSLGVISRSVAR